MKHDAHKLSNSSNPVFAADLAERALARQNAQLEKCREAIASASTDWELLLAQIKLNQTEMDGKILRGEAPPESQFLFNCERAKVMKIRWDFGALMRIEL